MNFNFWVSIVLNVIMKDSSNVFLQGTNKENVSAPLLLAHLYCFSRLDGTRALLVHWDSKSELVFRNLMALKLN